MLDVVDLGNRNFLRRVFELPVVFHEHAMLADRFDLQFDLHQPRRFFALVRAVRSIFRGAAGTLIFASFIHHGRMKENLRTPAFLIVKSRRIVSSMARSVTRTFESVSQVDFRLLRREPERAGIIALRDIAAPAG